MFEKYRHFFYVFVLTLIIINFLIWSWFFVLILSDSQTVIERKPRVIKTETPIPTPMPLPPLPSSYILESGTHSFQTFNNCGPASLSMALSYYDIFVSQSILGQELRPWQNAQGDNDDKSVTLAELAEKARDFGFTPFHRPAGDIEIVKRFISQNIPVVTRTNLDTTSDIGHFRVIVGYDDSLQSFVQDDSLQGNDLYYSYTEYDALWKVFGYEFLVLVPEEKIKLAESILGDLKDEKKAWRKAVETSDNPFNRSVAYYHLGEYQNSIQEFEKAESSLTFRTLWYQIEPILSYYEVGNYSRVFEITDNILNNHNRAFSELYALRGEIYLMQGDTASAISEYDKAVLYKKTDEGYKQRLDAIMASEGR